MMGFIRIEPFKKLVFSMLSLFRYIHKYVYMTIKSQKPNLEGLAMFYFIVFQLFAPHQAKLDGKKKTAKHVSMRIIPVCFHFSSSSTSADLKRTRNGCSVRGKM